MKLKWKKTGRQVTAQGTTLTYEAEGSSLTIESRKRHLPHANNRPGTWDYTDYPVRYCRHELFRICRTLTEAKAYVEELEELAKEAPETTERNLLFYKELERVREGRAKYGKQ